MKYGQMLFGAALALAGVLFGFAIATPMDAMQSGKWWEIVSAVGTAGAVIVALGIAIFQGLAMSRARYDDAVLLVVEAYPKLLTLADTCRKVRQYFAGDDYILKPTDSALAWVNFLLSQTGDASFPRATSLRPLGECRAAQMAKINSHLWALEGMRSMNHWMSNAAREKAAATIVKGMDEVIPCLQGLGEFGLAQLIKMER